MDRSSAERNPSEAFLSQVQAPPRGGFGIYLVGSLFISSSLWKVIFPQHLFQFQVLRKPESQENDPEVLAFSPSTPGTPTAPKTDGNLPVFWGWFLSTCSRQPDTGMHPRRCLAPPTAAPSLRLTVVGGEGWELTSRHRTSKEPGWPAPNHPSHRQGLPRANSPHTCPPQPGWSRDSGLLLRPRPKVLHLRTDGEPTGLAASASPKVKTPAEGHSA